MVACQVGEKRDEKVIGTSYVFLAIFFFTVDRITSKMQFNGIALTPVGVAYGIWPDATLVSGSRSEPEPTSENPVVPPGSGQQLGSPWPIQTSQPRPYRKNRLPGS
jgi:hypothetical protein